MREQLVVDGPLGDHANGHRVPVDDDPLPSGNPDLASLVVEGDGPRRGAVAGVISSRAGPYQAQPRPTRLDRTEERRAVFEPVELEAVGPLPRMEATLRRFAGSPRQYVSRPCSGLISGRFTLR